LAISGTSKDGHKIGIASNWLNSFANGPVEHLPEDIPMPNMPSVVELAEYLPAAAMQCWPSLTAEAQAILWIWNGGCVQGDAACIADDTTEAFTGIRKEWFDGSMAGHFKDCVWRVLHAKAHRGDLDAWASSPQPLQRLSLLILLDQVPRSIYKGTPRAYASDTRARSVARQSLADGCHERLPANLRIWFYFPFMHSEHLGDQRFAQKHLTEIVSSDSSLRVLEESIEAHIEAVRLFGRLPERNKVLGRNSTPEEVAYMKMRPTC
jgi:uncharacterized protein (DUF924 family)